MQSDEYWMRIALAEAVSATEHADVPIGAVVVAEDGTLLAKAHAEIVALREAAKRQGHWRLEATTVYVTLEPCAMCAGALVNARIGRLVYGARDPKAGAIDSLFQLAQDARLNHRFAVTSGLCSSEAVAELQKFFARLRALGEK